MEERFKKVIEEIKETNEDSEDTKRYILKIKKVFRDTYEQCKDEDSESEILETCLEEYEKGLKFRGKAEVIFHNNLMYNAYKQILLDYRKNKPKFDQIMTEAKALENKNKVENVMCSVDSRECVVSAVRLAMRNTKSLRESEIIEEIKEQKNKYDGQLRRDMIKVIQSSVATLEEYGIIDEYIESSNDELEQLGLSDLKFVKRNPIADEQYCDGKLVKDVEDIGVIDTFFTENLSNMSIEDLGTITAFYESKYLQERLGISRAMYTIKTLNLWDTIFHGEDKEIEDIDNNIIDSVLKRDLALTYLSKNGVKITPKIEAQYRKFLEENNINSDTKLEDDVKSSQAEVANLSFAARDIGVLECLLVQQLKEKNLKVKKWGVINNKQKADENQEDDDKITIAIESQNFRGPLIMEISETTLMDIFGMKASDFPDYKGNLDEVYCNIMSKLYLPSNNFFSKSIKKLYKENPQSQILANLTGKKVKLER